MEFFSDSSPQRNICICCTGLIILISVILFACSFDTVEPVEWGLLCNSITKSCEQDQVYEGGRYFIYLAHYFIVFPSTYQTIEFSNSRKAHSGALRTRTKEGLNLGLHVSFQYRLIRDQIPSLYSMNNKDYEVTFIRIARDVILQAAGRYEAPSYWQERKEIADQMQKELDNELKKAHANCINLQLLNIELPDSYEDSIVLTQVEVQKKKMKLFEQEAEMIRQSIKVLKSDNDADIKSINASAVAEAYKIRQQSVANATNITIEAESNAYSIVQNDLGLDGKDLNTYIYYNSLMGQKDAKVLVGMDNGLLNLNGKA